MQPQRKQRTQSFHFLDATTEDAEDEFVVRLSFLELQLGKRWMEGSFPACQVAGKMPAFHTNLESVHSECGIRNCK
jgi:hypothetical protein